MPARLYISKSIGRGRGVYCRDLIKKDQIIETCHVLVIPACEADLVKASGLVDYFFNFNKDEGSIALALGFGSLYNHAVHANAAYDMDKKNRKLRFFALEDIPPHTEVTINYGGENGMDFNQWFELRNIRIK